MNGIYISIPFCFHTACLAKTQPSIHHFICRQARLPVQFNLSDEAVEQSEDNDSDNAMEVDFVAHTRAMIELRRKALQNIKLAQGRQKKYYDSKHCKDKEKYQVGALVLLKNSRKLSRKGSMLEPNWTGPYRIHESAGKGTYRVCRCTDPTSILSSVYNITRLKLYRKKGAKKDVKNKVGNIPHTHLL